MLRPSRSQIRDILVQEDIQGKTNVGVGVLNLQCKHTVRNYSIDQVYLLSKVTGIYINISLANEGHKFSFIMGKEALIERRPKKRMVDGVEVIQSTFELGQGSFL